MLSGERKKSNCVGLASDSSHGETVIKNDVETIAVDGKDVPIFIEPKSSRQSFEALLTNFICFSSPQNSFVHYCG